MAAKVLDGRYKLIKKIGAGGFGQTFIARDMRRPGSPPCVVKQLKPASDDPNFIREARRLFNTEAETLEKLGRHDQIPQLLAYFEEDKQFFLVQEFVEGRSLYDEMKAPSYEPDVSDNEPHDQISIDLQKLSEPIRDKQLGEMEVINILKDVLNVLEFVHSEGVIHRDIKPDNLIRRKKDQKVVLIDFGAVKAMQDANTKLTAHDNGESRFTVTIGTPGYMPSEQCAGRPNYSSDIYALGMVAVKALTGYSPTDLPTDPATGEIVWRDKAQVSNGLAMVLTRMIRYHYTQRYQSVREVNQGITTFATMTEVERQATTSKIVRSVSTSNPSSIAKHKDSSTNGSSNRRTVASNSSSNSNSGVFFLFGGLLTTMIVIAAFAIPAMRNKPSTVVVNNPPISIAPTSPDPVASQPPKPASSEPVNQILNLVANQELLVSKTMVGNAGHTYTFQAKAGQILNSAITGDGMTITIINPQGIALPDAVNVLGANAPLAFDGAYTIQIRGVTKNPEVPYQLKLSLKDAAIASPNPAITSAPNQPPIALPPPTGAPLPSPQASPTPVATQAPAPKIEIKIRNN